MNSYFFDPHVVKMNDLETAWQPTPHGIALGTGMAKVPYVFCGKSMIEIGTGSGIHAILAKKLGARYIDVTEIDSSALVEANEGAILSGVEFRNLWVRDWFNFEPQKEKYDFVLCNPPFAKAEKGNRRWFISSMIDCSRKFLESGGYLMFSQSSMANFKKTEEELLEHGYRFDVVHSSRGVFRDYYFTEEDFIKESEAVEGGFEIVDGVYIETIQVYLCTLK